MAFTEVKSYTFTATELFGSHKLWITMCIKQKTFAAVLFLRFMPLASKFTLMHYLMKITSSSYSPIRDWCENSETFPSFDMDYSLYILIFWRGLSHVWRHIGTTATGARRCADCGPEIVCAQVPAVDHCFQSSSSNWPLGRRTVACPTGNLPGHVLPLQILILKYWQHFILTSFYMCYTRIHVSCMQPPAKHFFV